LRSPVLVTTPVAHKLTWKIVDAEIQDVAVGQRVPAANPEMSISGENDWQNIDPRFYRVITVHVDRADGSKTEIKLLRSLDWIKNAVRLLNGEYSVTSITNLVDKEIELVIPELDIETNAKILSVQPCPLIPDGPGEVVTATLKTNRAHVLDLVFEPTRGPPSLDGNVVEQSENVAIESLGETIELGVTPEHQIWSIDRAQFIPAGELSLNEHCITIDEKVYQLKSKTEQQNPVPVYNFEVSNQHVYYVSSEGLLVHNANQGYSKSKNSKPKSASQNAKKTAQSIPTASVRQAKTDILPIVNPNFKAKPTTLGKVGEVLAGAKGVKSPIVINGRTRIPDKIDELGGTLSEVKNVARQSYTRQLRDYADFARQNNLKFQLYVRPSTKFSRPLQEAIDNDEIIPITVPGL
jgi:hypothetical protein